ncbi:hypothetical protein ACWFRB_01340 [Rhodococcus sp. NPDC055112]
MPSMAVQRAGDRAHQRYGWLESWQSFPFAGNFDLAANAHGLLVVNNEDIVDAGSGFDMHQHRDAELDSGRLVTVASGLPRHRDHAAIGLNNRHAGLHPARLQTGQSVTIPDAPYVHVFVARGSGEIEGFGRLDQGDSLRLTGIGGQQYTAAEPTELLIWEMHAALG